MKRTPLYEDHKTLKARLIPFGGWDMPVQYKGVGLEHLAVREDVGLFDVSHMGEFLVKGTGAKDFLQKVTTNDVAKLYDGRCQYSLMCYENGTVVDDLIVSQVSNNEFILVVNASNIEKDFAWLNQHLSDDVTLENLSDQKALLALQGPKAQNLLNEFLDTDFSGLKYYHFQPAEYQGINLLVFRTGYTGEDGFELMVPAEKASLFWNDLLKKGSVFGIEPIGLGARDTLRLEACFSLYGHEISDAILPLEAGLGWVVKLDKGDFIGRGALIDAKETGLKRKLVALEMVEAGIAREGYEVFQEGEKIGVITSGTHSPLSKKSIALALVSAHKAQVNDEVQVNLRGKNRTAKVVKKPFYARAS